MVLDDHHGDGRFAIWCAAGDGVQGMLVGADPERFFRPPYVGHRGWLGVRLDRGLDLGRARRPARGRLCGGRAGEAGRGGAGRRVGSFPAGAKSRRMWFRRRRRLPPPTLLPSLDRLAELIERVVALLDQVSLAPEPGSRAGAPAARRNHPPPAAVAAPYLLFVPLPRRVRALERNGSAPAAGATTDVDGAASSSSASGRRRSRATSAAAPFWRKSPRRSEPSTSERGEPDRAHAGGDPGRPRTGRAGAAAVDRERPRARRAQPAPEPEPEPPSRRACSPLLPPLDSRV